METYMLNLYWPPRIDMDAFDCLNNDNDNLSKTRIMTHYTGLLEISQLGRLCACQSIERISILALYGLVAFYAIVNLIFVFLKCSPCIIFFTFRRSWHLEEI